jgi:hypothetical protein
LPQKTVFWGGCAGIHVYWLHVSDFTGKELAVKSNSA